jgi:hypothetical protein
MLQNLTPTAEKVETLPQAQPAQPKGLCAECGTRFHKVRPHQQFCSTAHAKSFQNRQNVEGRAVVALAKAWRAGRNLGKGQDAEAQREVARQALSELCAILDGFNAADKQASRPNPLHYAKSLIHNQAGRYIDRQRSR